MKIPCRYTIWSQFFPRLLACTHHPPPRRYKDDTNGLRYIVVYHSLPTTHASHACTQTESTGTGLSTLISFIMYSAFFFFDPSPSFHHNKSLGNLDVKCELIEDSG